MVSKTTLVYHNALHSWSIALVVLLFLSPLLLVAQNTNANTPTEKDGVQKPSDAVINASKAMDFFNRKDYDNAIKYFREALKTDKDNTDYEYEIALAYVMKKEQDKAIAILQKIITSKTVKDNYYQLLGNLYAEKDDTAKARATYSDGLKALKKSGRLRMELGAMRLQEHLLDEAIDEFEEGIQTDPGFYQNYYWAAKSYSGTSEKIWSILYAEVFANAQSGSVRMGEISRMYYEVNRKVFEEFDQSKQQMQFSKATKGATDASNLNQVSFEETVNSLMTTGAQEVKFNRDFEIPISAIDTIHTQFVKDWFARGWDKKFPNDILSRKKQLLDKGLLTAYHYYLMQFAKPLEAQDYINKHKNEYKKLEQWLKEHPLVMEEKNRFSRFFY